MAPRWLLLALLALPGAVAHGGGDSSVFVEAFDDDGYYFMIEGYDGRNPQIVLEPGTHYNVTFANRGTLQHNFRVSTVQELGTPLVSPGDVAYLEFTVPTSGFNSYWCDPHRGAGMQGQVASSADENGTPGPALPLLLAALALMTFWRRP